MPPPGVALPFAPLAAPCTTKTPARQRRLTLGLACLRRLEKALRRFRKATNNLGHLRILRNRKTFESAHDKKIRKAKESAMRMARARRSARSRAAAGF